MHLRIYMFATGAAVLLALYLDWPLLLFGIAALVAFEGLTNLKLTALFSAGRGTGPDAGADLGIPFEADRAWRLTIWGRRWR